MKILHELNQLDFGGVEKVIRNIIAFDTTNEHTILAHKDGSYRAELEKVGAKIVLAEADQEVPLEADVIHIHTGGGRSKLVEDTKKLLPVIETIHSPVRSIIDKSFISQRVGVTNTVSKLNHDCITIYNGIVFEDLLPRRSSGVIADELKIPSNVPIVGRLGRIGQDKELENWLLTCYHLQQEGLHFIPVIVGPEASTAKGYRGKLKLMVESLPVKNVIWVDETVDIADYLQIMDVFLYPSPTEGFGLVFIEAMYSGCSVVTYSTDVTKECLGGLARLSENSIYALRDALREAIEVKLTEEQMITQMDFVNMRYCAKRMSEEYQELYKKVVKDEQSN